MKNASEFTQIKRGLDLPIAGKPSRNLVEVETKSIGILGSDTIGLKPKMEVQEGDSVLQGQVLFRDKENPLAQFVAPFAGKVTGIHRGQRRRLESVVIERTAGEEKSYSSHSSDQLKQLNKDQVVKQLVDAGMWASLRKRPFGKIPQDHDVPEAIFVRAIDTEPLSFEPAFVIRKRIADFQAGLEVLKHLTSGHIYVCQSPYAKLDFSVADGRCKSAVFSGKHPAGLVGTHIHFLHPVGEKSQVWYLDYQDLIAVGHLFSQGKLDTHRVISFAGPQVNQPELYKVPLGVDLEELSTGKIKNNSRLISGSVLSGRSGSSNENYLGRYHHQVSVISETVPREFLGWQMPGFKKFSVKNTYLGKFWPGAVFNFTSAMNGSLRALVPVGAYEQIMPLDFEPTFLLRSLLSQDSDGAQTLGALELEEEDLSLCTFVCPSKNDYGPLLRNLLTKIEKEG